MTEAVPLAQDDTKGKDKLLIVLRGLRDGSVDAQALAEALDEHGLSPKTSRSIWTIAGTR